MVMPKLRYFNADVDSDNDAEDESQRTKKKGNTRDETYVSIGTPLPEIEDFDAEAKKESRPVIQARVHGAKLQPGSDMPRLHGAFTGGFSAGYFNTVGSKEGFVPSTFVSSRQLRAQMKEQKAVDYMDDEDVSEHGIAPRQVRASENFSSFARIEKETSEAVKHLPSTVIPEFGSGLADLVSPAQTNIGIKLLMSMGWRHGQGAGPRLMVDRKKLKSKSNDDRSADSVEATTETQSKMYGCLLPPGLPAAESEDSEEDENIPVKLDFAPNDLAPYSYAPKADVHGLGYSGMSADDTPSESSSALFAKLGKRGIRGQAFGVGFEGDDPEDSDIYTVDSIKNYDFLLEDKVEENEERKNVFHGWTAPALTSGKSKPNESRVLAGFLAGTKSFFRRQTTKLPELPPNYKPIRGYIAKEAPNEALAGVVMGTSTVSRSRFDQKEVMTAKHRAAILESGDSSSGTGTEKKSSIFDYIRPEDKYKLDAAVAATKVSKLPPESTEYEQVEDKNISSAPLKQFDPSRPFASDPEKQSRYEAFLQFRQINKDYSDLDLPTGMTEWEKQREREQFERAARLLQPLSWSIAQRFTRGSTTTGDDDTMVEVNRDDVNDNLSEMKHAVKLKMFGKLTRSSLEWHPAPLLCKRFNVRNPYPDSQLVGLPKVRKSKYSIFNFLNVSEPVSAASSSAAAVEVEDNNEGEAGDTSIEEGSAKDPALEAAESLPLPSENPDEDQRPSMDIFAAIFGDESEGEQEEPPSESALPEKIVEEQMPQQMVKTSRFDHPPPQPETQHVAPPTRVPDADLAPPKDPERVRREEGISAFLAGIFGPQAAKPQKPPEPQPRAVAATTSSQLIPGTSNPGATSQTQQLSSTKVEAIDSYGPKVPIHLLIGPSVHDAVVSSSESSYSDELEDAVQVISSDSEPDRGKAEKPVKVKSSKHKKKHKHHHQKKHKKRRDKAKYHKSRKG